MSSILVSEKKLLTIFRIVNNFFESDYVLVKLFERNGKFFFFFFLTMKKEFYYLRGRGRFKSETVRDKISSLSVTML